MNVLATFCVCSLLFLGGCTFSGRPPVARSQVLRRVPIGTPIDAAKDKLAQAGFRALIPGPVFYDMAVTPPFTHTNITLMFFDRTRTMYFGQRRWIIGLPYDDHGVVTNVFVQVWDQYWMEL